MRDFGISRLLILRESLVVVFLLELFKATLILSLQKQGYLSEVEQDVTIVHQNPWKATHPVWK
jgi:hypothetical protein